MELKNIHSDIISATDIGLVREVNEDSCGVTETPNGTLCIVCDGMGGHVGGEEASRIAVSCIIQYFNKEVYPNIRQALKDALDFANLQIIGNSHDPLQKLTLFPGGSREIIYTLKRQ